MTWHPEGNDSERVSWSLSQTVWKRERVCVGQFVCISVSSTWQFIARWAILRPLTFYPLGPACSDTVEPLAGVAKHFRTVVITYSAEGDDLFHDEAEEILKQMPLNSEWYRNQKLYIWTIWW